MPIPNKDIAKSEAEEVVQNEKDVATKYVAPQPTKPLMMFPKSFSRKVSIIRKPISGLLPGIDSEEVKMKIGSSFRGSSVNRGLTFAEEEKFLGPVIGVSPDSQNWESKTREYWINISREVPPKSGLELEVGLRYDNEDDYNYDQRLPLNENGIFIGTSKEKMFKGVPINLADYILYRYCLVYAKVANDFSKAYMTANIDFYLTNKDKEVRDKKIILAQKQEAMKIYSQRLSDRNWVDYLLRVLIAEDKAAKVSVRDLLTISDDEKDILLDEYMNSNPARFIALGNDRNLETKSFIELGISLGILNRIPNTATITLDGDTIGNTMDEAVSFLNNPKNAEAYQVLRAKARVVPST